MDEKQVYKLKRELAKQFMKDYAAHKAIDKSKRPDCAAELYGSFLCCRFHRGLNDRFGVLQERAKVLSIPFHKSGLEPICDGWWLEFCSYYGLPLPLDVAHNLLSQ